MSDPVTHCWPSGNANPPSTLHTAGPNEGNGVAATGTLQGIMVWLHGLVAAPNQGPFPVPLQDVGGVLPLRALTLANTIAATGWQVVNPVLPGDGFPGGEAQIIYNDIGADAGHGSRAVATWCEWWDHEVWKIRKNISATAPIVPVGMSMGGYIALLIAINRTATIAGYVAHHPASVLSDINPVFSPPLTFSSINTTGADVGSAALAPVTTIPGMLGWGSVDQAVGAPPWTADTLTPAIYAARGSAPITPNCDGTGTSAAGSPAENHVLTSSTDNANPNNDVFRIAAWFNANLPHN